MNDILSLVGIGLGLALALEISYEIVRWIRRMLTLRAADRIARSYSTEQALASGEPTPAMTSSSAIDSQNCKQVSAHRVRRTPPPRSWSRRVPSIQPGALQRVAGL